MRMVIACAAVSVATLLYFRRRPTCEHQETINQLKAEVARLDNALNEEQIRSAFFMARLIYAFGTEATKMDSTQFLSAVNLVRSALDRAVLAESKPITALKQ